MPSARPSWSLPARPARASACPASCCTIRPARWIPSLRCLRRSPAIRPFSAIRPPRRRRSRVCCAAQRKCRCRSISNSRATWSMSKPSRWCRCRRGGPIRTRSASASRRSSAVSRAPSARSSWWTLRSGVMELRTGSRRWRASWACPWSRPSWDAACSTRPTMSSPAPISAPREIPRSPRWSRMPIWC